MNNEVHYAYVPLKLLKIDEETAGILVLKIGILHIKALVKNLFFIRKQNPYYPISYQICKEICKKRTVRRRILLKKKSKYAG